MLTVNWNCYHYYHHLAIFSFYYLFHFVTYISSVFVINSLLFIYQKISKWPGGACVRRRGPPVPRHNGTMASPSLAVVQCPSVCLSVAFVTTAEDIVKLLSRPGSPHHHSFLTPSADTEFQGNPVSKGAKYTGGKLPVAK